MGSATELERLVVRLVGDASDYNKAMKQAVAITKASEKEIAEAVTKATMTQEAALRRAVAAQEKASAVTRAARAPIQVYNQKLNDLRRMHQRGEISTKVYTTSVRNLNREFAKGRHAVAAYGKRIKAVGQSMVATGRMMTIGVTLPIVGIGFGLVKAGANAEETQNKFEVVFSSVAAAANTMANELDVAYGMSASSAKDLMANTADLLSGFGFTQKSALELSGQVNKLAVDLASLTNFAGGSKGASEALTKALLGERESVKALGIAILESDVKKQVAINTAKGMKFATERQAKAQATLDIALRQSKNAIGDYERSGGSFVQQMTEMKGDVADLAVQLGQILMPVMKDLVAWVIETVKWFKEMDTGWQKNIIIAAAVAAAVGPILVVLGMLASAIGTILYVGGLLVGILGGIALAVGWPVVAIAAVVAAIVGLVAWIIGPESLAAAWRTLVDVAEWVWEKITWFFGKIKDAAVWVWKNITAIFSSKSSLLEKYANESGRAAGKGFRDGFEEATTEKLTGGAVSTFIKNYAKALTSLQVSGPGGPTPDKPTGAGFAAESKAAKLTKEIDKLQQKVAGQVATFGKAGAAVALWKLEQQGATEAQLAGIRASERQLQVLRAGQLVEKMQEQVRIFNLAGHALEIYKLKQMGATWAQLQAAKATEKQLRVLEAGKVLEKLREQVRLFGKAGRALEIFKLRQAGATTTQIKAAKVIHKQLADMEKFEKLEADAVALTKQHRTPLQRLNSERAKLNKMLDEGLITLEIFNKEMAEIEEKFKKDIVIKLRVEDEGVEAQLSGSVRASRELDRQIARLTGKGGVKIPADPAIAARKAKEDAEIAARAAAARAHEAEVPEWIQKRMGVGEVGRQEFAAQGRLGELPLEAQGKFFDEAFERANRGQPVGVFGATGDVQADDPFLDMPKKATQENMERVLGQIEENTRPKDSEITLEAADLTTAGA